ncbi:MAG: response regulator [Lachnospiraceae bacterium]|nr:response regulator [Lachnospiraceae bacterium]
MANANGKSIGIVVYQNSVVVRGIEKKLVTEGYRVEVLVEEFERVKAWAATTDLFILYLSGEIAEDRVKKKQLTEFCNTIINAESKLIVIGEANYHEKLLEVIPQFSTFTWLNRPVDLEILPDTIESVIATDKKTEVKKRILLVDDDPAFAKMVREWIKDKYDVDIVTAGMQAIQFLVKNKVDLILLDYEMPVVDGPQVLQMLRSDETTKDIPVFFLTGVGTREGVARVMELKPNGYILKSTPREELLAHLKKKLK